MEIGIHSGSPGLANRIKNYVSILTTFKQALTTKSSDAYIFDSIDIATEEQLNAYPCYDNWRLYVEEREKKYLDKFKHIDLLFDKTPSYFIEKYKKAFSYLKINKDILDYVDEFAEDWDDMIGLHIRSCHNKKIFLCGDNDQVLNYFENKYGDRIITHSQERYTDPHLAESGHNSSIQTNVDAFIDLMLLSKCSTIIGTYASTFAEVAWWLGQCKSKVIIPEPVNAEESFKNRIFEIL
jgi:hypothetical protein